MPTVHRHMSRDLLTVEAGLPVVAAAQRMAERNVGAVLVMEDGRLAVDHDRAGRCAPLRVGCATMRSSAMKSPRTRVIAPDDTIKHAAVLDDPRRLPPSTRG